MRYPWLARKVLNGRTSPADPTAVVCPFSITSLELAQPTKPDASRNATPARQAARIATRKVSANRFRIAATSTPTKHPKKNSATMMIQAPVEVKNIVDYAPL